MDIDVPKPGEEDALDAFLRTRADQSVLLRSNLHAVGLVDGAEPYHGTYVAARDDGDIVAVAFHGWHGNLLVQAPVAVEPLARACVERSGRPVRGLLGPCEQARAARTALGLDAAPTAVDSDDLLFGLDLADLRIPSSLDDRVTCRRATAADADPLVAWRAAYLVETLRFDESRARAEAPGLLRRIDEGALFVLERDGAPRACASYTAIVDGMTEVGFVYAPPAHRGRGHGRAVVAGTLEVLRAEGVRRAILFTDPPNPGRPAYEALGFRVIGRHALILFADR